MFFRLHHDCHIVKGAKRSALYNTKSGKVLSLNQGAVDLLAACQNQPLETIMDVTDIANHHAVSFLQTLSTRGCGCLWITEPDSAPAMQTELSKQGLDFLWLEVTNSCNNRCLHCYADSAPCQCSDIVPHERWLSLIAEARTAGAAAIQLIGGEPLLYPRWRELVKSAVSNQYELIEIFTNGTLITDNDINFFKRHKVSIATTIYAANDTIHDRITLHQGSFAKTLASIRKILHTGIPLRIASIIMKPNENEANNIMQLCASLGVEVNPPDVIRPTGRGDDRDLLPANYAKPPIKPPFYTDAQGFSNSRKWHSCLAGKLAVTAAGDVIPCIFARSQLCGNVLTQSLADIIAGDDLQQCWQTTKDKITKCQDCEYRYACSDCRPLAQSSDQSKQWLACPHDCLYNPYTGIWANSAIPDPTSTDSLF